MENVDLVPGNEGDWLVAVQFPHSSPDEFIEYVESWITKSKQQDGLEFVSHRVYIQSFGGEASLLLKCTTKRFEEIARSMKIKAAQKDIGSQFVHPDDTDDDIFYYSEKQRLIIAELEQSWKVKSDNFSIPGHPGCRLNPGDSVVSQCVRHRLIKQIFPLHDKRLERLSEDLYSWKAFLRSLPLDGIRNYFGESISMYFGFLEFYQRSLIIPSVVGIMFYFTGYHRDSFSPLILLALFNIVWCTAFLEGWKRKSSSLAYHWGTWDLEVMEIPKASYHGKMGINPVTGEPEPRAPKSRRLFQIYCVSVPIIALCLLVCTLVMLGYFEFVDYITVWYDRLEHKRIYHDLVTQIPTGVYIVAIVIMNQMYKPLAIKLTEWENHRLQSTYDKQITVKLVLFWFVNTFMLLFYIAFVLQDLAMLRRTLLIALVITQSLDQLQETILPYIMYKLRKQNGHNGDAKVTEQEKTCLQQLDNEACKERYEGTFDDFLELFIQFGYVTLFSCVFPLAALFALINNIIEMRTDSLKLCTVFQRPFALPVNGIGAWQLVFELMGYMAIITNSALIGLMLYQSNIRLFASYGQCDIVFLAIALEHGLIILRATVAFLIPDEDRAVRLAKARDVYLMRTKFNKSQ